MGHELSTRRVTLGAMLLIGPLCVGAVAQSPRTTARPNPYAAAPSQTPPGAPALMPQSYAPAATHPGTFGLSALPQPAGGYATPVSAVAPQPSQPASSPPPAAAAPQSDAASGGLRARFPKLLQNVRNATMTPGQKLAQQAAAAPMPAAQPNAGASPRLVRAQTPVALPQGPVIVYMPAGWQPPQDITFAPRQVSPEVSDDFWPESTRNPFGETAADGGLMRWPKFTRPNSPEELPVENPQTRRALLASSEADPGDDERTTATKRAWNALLGTTNGSETARNVNGRKPSKALFSGLATSNPPQRPAAAPARSTVASQGNRPQPVTRPAVTRQVPQALVSSVAPAARAQAAAAPAPQQSASRLKTTVLADFQPTGTENSGGQLKWRAKGAPRVSSPAVDNSHNQVAAHVQPVDSTPMPAMQSAPSQQPATTYPAVQQQQPAAYQETAPAPVVRQKALIPKSVMTGKPLTPSPTLAQPGPQPSPPVMTTAGAPQYAVQSVAADPATATDASGKALFPNMFAKDSPMSVGLTTKPPPRTPPAMPQAAKPVYVVLAPKASAELVDSYYAPTPVEQPEPPRMSSRRKQKPAASADERSRVKAAPTKAAARQYKPSQRELARQAFERAAAARPKEPTEYVSPLEKPLRAIGEMTKLPKFITGESGNSSAPAGPLARRKKYRATVVRRADPREKPDRPTEAEPLDDDEVSEFESGVAPDVAVDVPAKRRDRAGRESRDQEDSRPNSQLADQLDKSLTARTELDRLYRSAVGSRKAAGDKMEDEADRQVDNPQPTANAETPHDVDSGTADTTSIDTAPGNEHPDPSVNVPAVAIEENVSPSNSRSTGRRQVVRESRLDLGTQRSNPLR